MIRIRAPPVTTNSGEESLKSDNRRGNVEHLCYKCDGGCLIDDGMTMEEAMSKAENATVDLDGFAQEAKNAFADSIDEYVAAIRAGDPEYKLGWWDHSAGVFMKAFALWFLEKVDKDDHAVALNRGGKAHDYEPETLAEWIESFGEEEGTKFFESEKTFRDRLVNQVDRFVSQAMSYVGADCFVGSTAEEVDRLFGWWRHGIDGF